MLRRVCAALVMGLLLVHPVPLPASPAATSIFEVKTVSGMSSLVNEFLLQQATWLVLTPPGGDFMVEQSGGLVAFAPTSFPESFTKGLVGDVEHECPVYPVTLIEDPSRNAVIILNAEGVEIGIYALGSGHDPYRQLHQSYPALYSGLYSQKTIDELKKAYSPSRVHLVIKLLPVDYVDQYAKAEAAKKSAEFKESALLAESSLSMGGITPMMMYEGPPVSNLQFVAIEKMTNGMLLTLAYPTDFTNHVDFFTCSDLVSFWWDLAATTNVSTSNDWIEWLDTNAVPPEVRFYAAADADLDADQDGVMDGREKFMYHTSSATNDTDWDGLTDSNEIFVLNTDPNIGKTNKPGVVISYPASESRKVWLP